MEIKGWTICEYREWINTLNIKNIIVSDNNRRKRIGEKLIAAVINHSIKLIE